MRVPVPYIGALILIIAYIILGVPYHEYSIKEPKIPFQLLRPLY